MRLFIAVTDNEWYRFLAARRPDEVNFWRPGGGAFKAIEEGDLFLFKLHSPYDYIVGGGFFVRYVKLPLSRAWEAFGQKNGVPTYDAFVSRIARYRERSGPMELDPVIGCIMLAQPFFFEGDDWIPAPRDWSRNIVAGKTYDTDTPIGAHVYAQVEERLRRYTAPPNPKVAKEAPVLAERLRRLPLGEGAFDVLVIDAYRRRCAVTGERTLPVLEAAHIKPSAESGPHRVDNGLLLRADLHRLLDTGYITLTEALQVEVSRRIKEDFDNGGDYYAFHGMPLQVLPARAVERPSREFIRWHNQHRYRG